MNSYYRIYRLWYLTKGMKSSEKSVRCSPATDKENGITSSHKLQKISGGKEEGNYFDVSQSCFLLYWELQNGLEEAKKIFRIFLEHLIVWRETEGVQRHLGLSQESNFFLLVLFIPSQRVKNLPAVQETWIWFLSQEDYLEKGMPPTRSFLPGEFHGQRSLAGYIVHAKSQTRLSD